MRAEMKLLSPVLATFVCLLSSVARGQEELEFGGEEGPDRTIIEQAVAAVLTSEFNGFDPQPDQATTLSDPDVDLDELALELRPLPVDSLENELEAWRLLPEQRSRKLSEARIELLRLNRIADAEEEMTDAEGVDNPDIDPKKQELIEHINQLRDARIHASDRLHVVLEAYQAKGGDEDVVDARAGHDLRLADLRAGDADCAGLHRKLRDLGGLV